MDEIIGMYQGNCYHFSIQKPDFPKEFHQDLIDLTDTVVHCVEALCLTVRSFFRDIKTVRDNAHKVTFYEKESDINNPNTETKADHVVQDINVEVSPKGLNVLQKVMNQKNEEPKS